MKDHAEVIANAGKFIDPLVTADGARRARVALTDPRTLWFNTGTLCNIACVNCYIESSPTNDALVYIAAAEVADYLNQIVERNWGVREIGFTGGEPFMNRDFGEMVRDALSREYEVLILTNAMKPMMRPREQKWLLALPAEWKSRLTLRVSLDHHTEAGHDEERGGGAFEKALVGMRWLGSNGFRMAVAGRTLWGETESAARDGYAELFRREGFAIDAHAPDETILFPEMDMSVEVPEITTACWDILGKHPSSIMCASSRMVVKRKGAKNPAVLACTLLPYDAAFEMGRTLKEAERSVPLNHPHCAKFCVLGGASCTA